MRRMMVGVAVGVRCMMRRLQTKVNASTTLRFLQRSTSQSL
jgi:hypothetical protein